MGLVQKAFSDIITFSRSSNATRVGPTGLVEYAPHNLLTYSQELDNAAWSINAASIGANSISAPNGTVTADKLIENSTTAEHWIQQASTVVSTVVHTYSIYAKVAGRTKLRMREVGGTNATVVIDLTTGTVVSTSNGGTGTITSVGNDWYRCTLTFTSSGTTAALRVNLLDESYNASYTGNGTSGLYLWGAQLSVGSNALDYTPTTSAAVYGPRFDYDPVTLAAKGLLIEEQRSNIQVYSEDFSNAEWRKDGIIISANAATAPDGNLTADLLYPGSSGTFKFMYDENSGGSYSPNTNYAVSVFAKSSGKNWVYIRWEDKANASAYAYFDLANGVVGSVTGTLSVTRSITALGNGWYRCTVIGNSGTGTGGLNPFLIGVADADASTSVTASGTSGIYCWGAQAEAGSFATSYIPTLASSVTRSADVASVNTLSPWYSSTESTVYVEADTAAFSTSSNDRCAFEINDTTVNNFYRLQRKASTQAASALGITSGSLVLNTTNFASWTSDSVFKLAISLKANDVKMVANGGSVATDTSYSVPTVTKLEIGGGRGGDYLCGHVRRLAYYPRALASSELQALTA